MIYQYTLLYCEIIIPTCTYWYILAKKICPIMALFSLHVLPNCECIWECTLMSYCLNNEWIPCTRAHSYIAHNIIMYCLEYTGPASCLGILQQNNYQLICNWIDSTRTVGNVSFRFVTLSALSCGFTAYCSAVSCGHNLGPYLLCMVAHIW